MPDVTSVECLDGYRIRLRFEDGCEGVVDLGDLSSRGGVFALLEDPDYFRRVTLNSEIGTICWPNVVDLSPETLYFLATGKNLPAWVESPVRH